MTATDSRRVIYNVLEYSPLCDSSNMTMDDWIRIADDIKVKLYINRHVTGDTYYVVIKSKGICIRKDSFRECMQMNERNMNACK